MQRKILIATMLLAALCFQLYLKAQITQVQVSIPEIRVKIDPMIYGQMLENVNDSMIYGGVADTAGNERMHVTTLLKGLDIPVMRWPGGTVIHEYRWKNGIGSKAVRPVVSTYAWKGRENYQFGTDEFLQWCQRIGTAPYINFNMGNSIEFGGTLWEALEWIEYVNGSAESNFGKLRAYNGHKKPYGVKYWCIGNENYGPWGRHAAEADTTYAERLKVWSSTIKKAYPELSLLGIGHTVKWNEEVLARNGQYIDFLTQHYYVTSKLKDGLIENPSGTLFAPVKMEAHLNMLGVGLNKINKQLGRTDRPVRLSIDEWNNRHSVFNGTEYKFSRQSPRRQFDVPLVAGMLNVFIRQSAIVGMANYIFPVNAHGLIRTVEENDAFLTPLYYVFKQYREWMIGEKIEARIEGPGIMSKETKPTITGDCAEVKLENKSETFIDAAAVLTAEKDIHVSLVNRSFDKEQIIEITLPAGYKAVEIWEINHKNINASNTADNRYEIVPKRRAVNTSGKKVIIKLPACGLGILKLVSK